MPARTALRSWYLTQAEVEAGLPDGHGFTSDQLDEINERAASWVDGELSQRFWTPFPAATDSPGTPVPVRDLALIYAYWYGSTLLNPSSRNLTDSELSTKREFLAREVAKLMASDADSPKLGPDRKTGETIALGTWNGNTIDAGWHALACSPRDVVPESVVVTNSGGTVTYMNGWDFNVRYRPELRGWVLVVINAVIINGFKVSYSFSHYRRTEKDAPLSSSGEIYLS